MHFQKLYTDLFSGPGTDAVNAAKLKEVAQEFPYFSLAHFFLLKLAMEAGQDIDTVASKAALHFNNPLLLNEQLHKVPLTTNGSEIIENVEEDEIETEPATALREVEIRPVTSTSFEELQEMPGTGEENSIESTPVTTIKEEEILPETSTFPKDVTEIPETVPEETREPPIKDEAQAQDFPVNKKAVEATQEECQKEEVPIFEPLFASDYFASQGIKLTEEQQPTDRMGKQLKSFTEWLKTMKKVHDTKLPSAEAPVDMTVQNLAEKSNKEEQVLTEAMADVFLQQGKTNKAKEIYEKLSLLNPSKSAYFAAKLEQIK